MYCTREKDKNYKVKRGDHFLFIENNNFNQHFSQQLMQNQSIKPITKSDRKLEIIG